MVPRSLWTGNTVKHVYFRSKANSNLVKKRFLLLPPTLWTLQPFEKHVFSIKNKQKPCKQLMCSCFLPKHYGKFVFSINNYQKPCKQTCFFLVPPRLWIQHHVKNMYFQSQIIKNLVNTWFYQVSPSLWKEKATDISMVSVQRLGETD
jgi:hypothetical protein